MDSAPILGLGVLGLALFFLTRSSGAVASPYVPVREPQPYLMPLQTIPYDYAPSVADVEDAEIFQHSFPGYGVTVPDTWSVFDLEDADMGDAVRLMSESGYMLPTDAAPSGVFQTASNGPRNLDAFKRMLRRLEVGTEGPQGYARVHTAVAKVLGSNYITDFSDHPRITVPYGSRTTSAAGAYQFMIGTWDEVARALALPDFSPASQEAAADWLITVKRKALQDILAGRLVSAFRKLRSEWSSLPGGKEPQLSEADFAAQYASIGGMLDPGEFGTVYA